MAVFRTYQCINFIIQITQSGRSLKNERSDRFLRPSKLLDPLPCLKPQIILNNRIIV